MVYMNRWIKLSIMSNIVLLMMLQNTYAQYAEQIRMPEAASSFALSSASAPAPTPARTSSPAFATAPATTFAPASASASAAVAVPAPTNFSYDFGQTMVYMGGGVALVGASLFAVQAIYGDKHQTNQEDGTPVLPLFGAVGVIGGGILALIGAPFWYKGKQRLGDQTGPQYIGDPEGFATKFALAGSLMHPLSMDLVEGYHFNHHLFLGAGVGLRCLGSEPSIPVYVDFTYTPLKRRVSPYIGAKLGGDVLFLDSTHYDRMINGAAYMAFELGTRIRHRENDRGKGDWSIALYAESDAYESRGKIETGINVGLNVGYAF